MATQRRVFLETFGCQMNVLDSELVKDQLLAAGYDFAASPDDADVVLYNTCSVRDLSEQKVLSRLGRLRQSKDTNRDLVVGVLGCMAERTGQDLVAKYPHIDVMCGPSELDRITELIEQASTTRGRGIALSGHNDRRQKVQDMATERLEALDALRFADDGGSAAQAYVRITRGCNKFCSFCVVPFTRGPEVHRPADAIVDEVKRLVDGGAREVTLLGQTINHYAHEGTSFGRLLQRVHDEVPDLPRLRFLTSYPRDFTDEALDVMAGSERICKWLHIPAQHGNDHVLKRMNRGYTRADYLGLIERAKARMPDVSIVGDMIVGFPGETDAEFEDSLTLLDEVRFKGLYVFKYSPRPGTVAGKRDVDDVPQKVKKARNHRMLEHQQRISLEHHQAMVGETLEVLVEGAAKIDPAQQTDETGAVLHTLKRKAADIRLTSRTRGDHIVAFDGPASLVGELCRVTVTEARELSLSGVRA